MDEMDWMDRYQ